MCREGNHHRVFASEVGHVNWLGCLPGEKDNRVIIRRNAEDQIPRPIGRRLVDPVFEANGLPDSVDPRVGRSALRVFLGHELNQGRMQPQQEGHYCCDIASKKSILLIPLSVNRGVRPRPPALNSGGADRPSTPLRSFSKRHRVDAYDLHGAAVWFRPSRRQSLAARHRLNAEMAVGSLLWQGPPP